MKKLFVIFVFSTFPHLIFADEFIPEPVDGVNMECFKESAPVPWAFCINKMSESKNKNILYYLHARNGNETWWNDKTYHTGKLYDTWKELGIDPPTVVSISFGKLWLLTEDPNHERGGLHKVFLDSVIPLIEKKLGNPTGIRMLAGISMGGLNTLMFSTKQTGVFKKAASMCAPLAAVSPHDSFLNIIKYFSNSSTSLKRAFMLWKFSKEFYPTQEVWEANDPIFKSKTVVPDQAPEFYITCGAKDDWGCTLGSEIFTKNIKESGGKITWVPRPGGHCDIDYNSLAKFLN